MIYSLLLFAGLVGAARQNQNLDSYTFEKFVKDHKFDWDAKEIGTRKAIFESELARVKHHNSEGKSWKEGINKFSAYTEEEKQSMFGRSKKVKSAHSPLMEKPLPKNFKIKPVGELPESVDWRSVANTVSSVKDQGNCGSCWAFAATATLESHVALATGELYDFSPQQIAMCSPNPDNCGGTGGCQGATAEIAFDYVASAGVVEEYQIGYQAYFGQNSDCEFSRKTQPVATISGYTKLPENNYTALMNAIATVGPIAVSVDASTWSAYQSGVFSGCNQKSPVINHAVVLVGYGTENGEDYWLVRNSWSPSWGEIGYIKVHRDAETDEQNCGWDTEPQTGTACEGQDDPVYVCGTCGILYDSSYPLDAALA